MSLSIFSPRRRLIAASLGAAALQPLLALAADTWPSRPVRFIVPFPPGGPVDTTARIFSQKLADLWNVPTVIDNRAGAGGVVGATAAAKEAPDGYALFVGSIHHAVNPSLMGKLPYDIEKDFAPVSFAAVLTMVVVAHPAVPANTITELIALAKKEKGRLAYGSSGNGGGTHLAGELFDIHAGTRLLHVPYKGSAPAMNGLLGGEVQLMFSDASTALPFIKAGKIKALAVTSAKRSPLLPNVPTVAESGSRLRGLFVGGAVCAGQNTPSRAGQSQRRLQHGAERCRSAPPLARRRHRSRARHTSAIARTAAQ